MLLVFPAVLPVDTVWTSEMTTISKLPLWEVSNEGQACRIPDPIRDILEPKHRFGLGQEDRERGGTFGLSGPLRFEGTESLLGAE